MIWDHRGPCDGPRDCVGTERGCAVCDPGGVQDRSGNTPDRLGTMTHTSTFGLYGAVTDLKELLAPLSNRELPADQAAFREQLEALIDLAGDQLAELDKKPSKRAQELADIAWPMFAHQQWWWGDSVPGVPEIATQIDALIASSADFDSVESGRLMAQRDLDGGTTVYLRLGDV